MRDPFSYSSRWDSIGLDCCNCNHFSGPLNWPDVNKEIKCLRHRISLRIQLGNDGYKKWEWFCKHFDNRNADPESVKEFETIRSELDEGLLYRGYGENGQLVELNIDRLTNE